MTGGIGAGQVLGAQGAGRASARRWRVARAGAWAHRWQGRRCWGGTGAGRGFGAGRGLGVPLANGLCTWCTRPVFGPV